MNRTDKKMKFNKKTKLTFAGVLISIILTGCSGNSESKITKTVNGNQPAAALTNSVNAPPTPPAGNGNLSPAANPPPVNVNKDKNSPAAVKEPAPKIGSGGDDLALFTQARGALSADQELLTGVIVEIKEGKAALTGKVSSEAQKKKAEQMVQNVRGIKGVQNNLRVAP